MSAKVYLFPDRAHDEHLLQVMEGLARRGVKIKTAGDEELPVSPYLQRPLRTEAEARAAQEESKQ